MRTASEQGLPMLMRSLKLPRAPPRSVQRRSAKDGVFERYLRHLVEVASSSDSYRRATCPTTICSPRLTCPGCPLPCAPPSRPCVKPASDRAENLLAFGLPGRGKTHLIAAIGHELVQRGYELLFVPAFQLVRCLLSTMCALDLDTTRRKHDHFAAAAILDDLGYVQQSRGEEACTRL